MRPWAQSSIALLLLNGCASMHPDHFYALQSQPIAVSTTPQAFSTPINLKLTIPSLLDRNELVLRDGGNGVLVLEHERWAAPLADQMAVVLGQDLEQRRADIIVSARRASQAEGAVTAISVDIVELSAPRGGGVSMEARWRIERGGEAGAVSGREVFQQPTAANDYAQLAHAISACVGQLAGRLIEQLPPFSPPH